MDSPKFIVSSQKEESISIQRVNAYYYTWAGTFCFLIGVALDK